MVGNLFELLSPSLFPISLFSFSLFPPVTSKTISQKNIKLSRAGKKVGTPRKKGSDRRASDQGEKSLKVNYLHDAGCEILFSRKVLLVYYTR